MGHGKSRKCRKLWKKQQNVNHVMEDASCEAGNVLNVPVEDGQVTNQGRTIQKPARYCLNIGSCPQVSAFKGGSCMEDHMRVKRVLCEPYLVSDTC